MSLKRNTESADKIVKNILSFRKSNKECSHKNQPTPINAWRDAFTSEFPIINETGQSAIFLHSQILQYLNNGCVKFEEDLKRGTIPSTFSDGIQFYLDYLLRVIHIEISENDMMNAARVQSNMIDALSEYSLGTIISVMKMVFMQFYNPLSGLLRTNNNNNNACKMIDSHFHHFHQSLTIITVNMMIILMK